MNEDAIAQGITQRNQLSEECFQLLYQIAQKPSCLKLLTLVRNHLKLLAGYKSSRAVSK